MVLWIYSQLQQDDQTVALLLACWTSALLMSGQPVTPTGLRGTSPWRSRGRVNHLKSETQTTLSTDTLDQWPHLRSSGWLRYLRHRLSPAGPTSTTAKETAPMRGGSGRSAPQEESYPSQIKKCGKTCPRRALRPNLQLQPHHKGGKKMTISDIFTGCNFHEHSFDFNISFSKGASMGGNHLRNTGSVVYCLR